MDPRPERFDKFAKRARKALSLAHEEAARFNHNYIGTEHLLLGLVREGDGVAARVLADMGVQLHKVRSAVEFIVGRGGRPPQGEIGLTPRARRVIELAFDEARRQNHHYIGTEHLLLGLVREGQGVAAGVLESLGADLEEVRVRVLQALGDPEGLGPRSTNAGRARAGRVSRRRWPFQRAQGERFDKFTERARKALSLAHEEAARLNHNYLGTEHLLLGLIREGDGVAARVLTNMGVRLRKVRSRVVFIVGRGESPPQGEIGPTPRTRRIIELAFDEATRQNHHYIGTEHLLLGLVRETEGLAASILEELGVSLNQVRSQVVRVINESAAYSQPLPYHREQEDIVALLRRLSEIQAEREAAIRSHNYELAAEFHARAERLQEHINALREEINATSASWQYTDRAFKVLELAREEAVRLNHDYLGTEHLLVGLLLEERGLPAIALASAGVTLENCRAAVKSVVNGGEEPPGTALEFDADAWDTLDTAHGLMYESGRESVTSVDILMALLQLEETRAAHVLETIGVTVHQVHDELQALLS